MRVLCVLLALALSSDLWESNRSKAPPHAHNCTSNLMLIKCCGTRPFVPLTDTPLFQNNHFFRSLPFKFSFPCSTSYYYYYFRGFLLRLTLQCFQTQQLSKGHSNYIEKLHREGPSFYSDAVIWQVHGSEVTSEQCVNKNKFWHLVEFGRNLLAI